MTDTPDRIWIEAGDDCPYFYEEDELHEAGSPVTEYIRADLVAALEAENQRLRGALEDIHDGEPEWPDDPEKELIWCRDRARAALNGGGKDVIERSELVARLRDPFGAGIAPTLWFNRAADQIERDGREIETLRRASEYDADVAKGMAAEVALGDGAGATIIDPRSFADGGPEWVMRYGSPCSIRFVVASLLESYDGLLSDNITAREAVRRLRLMRSARAALNGEGET